MSNKKTNYLPWIILGGILLVFLSFVAVVFPLIFFVVENVHCVPHLGSQLR